MPPPTRRKLRRVPAGMRSTNSLTSSGVSLGRDPNANHRRLMVANSRARLPYIVGRNASLPQQPIRRVLPHVFLLSSSKPAVYRRVVVVGQTSADDQFIIAAPAPIRCLAGWNVPIGRARSPVQYGIDDDNLGASASGPPL